jgi:hypothetical protein
MRYELLSVDGTILAGPKSGLIEAVQSIALELKRYNDRAGGFEDAAVLNNQSVEASTPTPKPLKEGVAWSESGFSGDEYLIFETPETSLRWQVSVNRYGSSKASLFFMASGGGLCVCEKQHLAVAESEPDEVIAAAAREWAESLIADGSAIRLALFPPESTRDIKAHDALAAMQEFLWPPEEPDRDWDSETIEVIARLLADAGYGPPEGA